MTETTQQLEKQNQTEVAADTELLDRPRKGAIGKALIVWLATGSVGAAIIAWLLFAGMGC
jgi:hypothetical protein